MRNKKLNLSNGGGSNYVRVLSLRKRVTNMIKGYKNSLIYVEGKGIIRTNLSIKNGIIDQIGDDIDTDGFEELSDKQILIPGFVDEHIHGAGGSDAMNGTQKDLETIAKFQAMDGTTTFNFTTMTMEKGIIIKALTAINEYLSKEHEEGARAVGVHLEGPFISTAFCGAQNPGDILPLNVKDLDDFIAASGDHIKIATVCYKKGNEEFAKEMLKHNIAPSLGHSDDTSSEAFDAVKNGFFISTHTYNAQKGLHHRDVGTLGAMMLSDSVSCELIADLHHVCADAIRILYRMKGKDKITLITDSMEAKGLPDGMYQLGGQPVVVKNGTARLENGVLAGSILHLNEGVRNVKNVLGISLEEAIDMATINPARNLKMENEIGSIKVGKKADFAIIDKDVNVYKTIRDGRLVYSKE